MPRSYPHRRSDCEKLVLARDMIQREGFKINILLSIFAYPGRPRPSWYLCSKRYFACSFSWAAH